MKWLAVIGTRETTRAMERDIAERVTTAVRDGWSIVTGGSTGVDTAAIVTAMACGGRVRVYLPIPLDLYAVSLQARAEQGKCHKDDADISIRTLRDLKTYDSRAVIEPIEARELTPEVFYARNERVLSDASRVAAYHLEGNATASTLRAGTLLTVDRARELGLHVELYEYNT